MWRIPRADHRFDIPDSDIERSSVWWPRPLAGISKSYR